MSKDRVVLEELQTRSRTATGPATSSATVTRPATSRSGDGGAQPGNTCQVGTPVEPDAGAGNEPEDPGCVALVNAGTLVPKQPLHAFCDRTAAGNHRCAFHQCGSNKCYYAPVPVADIRASATTCTSPADCTNAG
jgi:hypothetical protein